MRIILKLKHWQIFIILLIATIMSNFTLVGNELFNTILNIAGTLIYFLWFFFLGLELTELLPGRVELSRTMFIINGFVLLLSIVVVIIVFDGSYSGNSPLAFLWIVYLFYAIFQFGFYPMKALKSIELNKEASLTEYIVYSLLLVFWPVGIWFIQPKLNTVANPNDEISAN